MYDLQLDLQASAPERQQNACTIDRARACVRTKLRDCVEHAQAGGCDRASCPMMHVGGPRWVEVRAAKSQSVAPLHRERVALVVEVVLRTKRTTQAGVHRRSQYRTKRAGYPHSRAGGTAAS